MTREQSRTTKINVTNWLEPPGKRQPLQSSDRFAEYYLHSRTMNIVLDSAQHCTLDFVLCHLGYLLFQLNERPLPITTFVSCLIAYLRAQSADVASE